MKQENEEFIKAAEALAPSELALWVAQQASCLLDLPENGSEIDVEFESTFTLALSLLRYAPEALEAMVAPLFKDPNTVFPLKMAMYYYFM